MDLSHREGEERLQERMHAFRAEALRQPGRTHDVAEQHGDLLVLAFDGGGNAEDRVAEVRGRV